MRKLFASVALVAIVSGCTGTVEERAAKRDVMMELAINRIDRFNAQGIDPIQLDDTQLLMLDTACVVVILGGTEYGLDVETLKTISGACEAIMKAAAKSTVEPTT